MIYVQNLISTESRTSNNCSNRLPVYEGVRSNRKKDEVKKNVFFWVVSLVLLYILHSTYNTDYVWSAKYVSDLPILTTFYQINIWLNWSFKLTDAYIDFIVLRWIFLPITHLSLPYLLLSSLSGSSTSLRYAVKAIWGNNPYEKKSCSGYSALYS